MARTRFAMKASMIYKATENLRAMQNQPFAGKADIIRANEITAFRAGIP